MTARDGLARLIMGAVLFFSLTAHSQNFVYLHHTRNQNLLEQFRDQPSRVLPQSALYSLGLDTYLYKPWNIADTYYHGNGYWLNALAELRPHEDITLNLKLISYNGASSYGYAAADFIQPMFALTWAPHFLPNVDLVIRYFDLDRQTLGAGLLLEEKEMNGLLISLSRRNFRYKGIVDGTGGFYRPGDLYYQQLDWAQDLLGVSFTFIDYESHEVTLLDPNTGNVQVFGPFGIPAWTFFSKMRWSDVWQSGLELGTRNQVLAGLARLKWEPKTNGVWSGFWEAQVRHYGRDFAQQIKKVVEQDYVSPEIEDKSFTETRNILAIDDNVQVYATRADLEFRPQWWLRAGVSNEIFLFQYRDREKVAGYLFKHAIEICPYRQRAGDCVSFFVADKAITATGNLRSDRLPAQSFQTVFNFGVEAFIYL